MKRQDLTGQVFGQLTVISRVMVGTQSRWNCRCACGGGRVGVRALNLRNGSTVTCGCRHVTHRQSRSLLHQRWSAMLTRCRGRGRDGANYGGRGIQVCEAWHSFERFCQWANQAGYQPELTLDRINVNGHYSPDNCRWATRKMQSRNQRRTIMHRGVPIAELAELTGTSWSSIRRRLRRGTLDRLLTAKGVDPATLKP